MNDGKREQDRAEEKNRTKDGRRKSRRFRAKYSREECLRRKQSKNTTKNLSH